MNSKEARGEGSRKGYRWLKSWLKEQGAGEGRLSGDREKALLEAVNMEALLCWTPRLFWEGSEADRMGILRGLVPVAGPKAAPFLEEVMASPGSGLIEKRCALEQFEEMGLQGDAAFEENLRKAEDFVASLPESLRNTGTPAGIPEEALSRFRGLSPLFQGVVLRELLRRFPQNVFRFLECVLAGQEDLWEEILEVLEEVPYEEAGRLLQSGHGRVGKGLRKKIRTIHHRRSARGLPVYPLERADAGEAVWRVPVPTRPEGLLSFPDSGGGRMVWVIRPNVRKGMLVFGGWVDDQRGLLKFFVMDFSRKEMEKYRVSLLKSPEFPVVECEAGYCASLLDEAYRKGTALSAEEVEAFKAGRPMLKEVVPAEKPSAPVYTVFSEDPEEAVLHDFLAGSERLLKEELLSDWVFEAERIEPHLNKLEEISESRIIVHPMQKKERMDALYRGVAEEILSDVAYRTSWRRRLEDAAWVFYKKDLEGQARRLAYISRYLEDSEKNASRVSFFVELVRRGMEGTLQERKTEEKQRPSLIVKP